jgi:hypothetical protein
MTKEECTALIEQYPFLLPRNVFTDQVDDDYDYSYIRGIGEIPKGWNKLFLQMCEDIKKQLVKENALGSFRFTQIKEKYNRLECYNNGCSVFVHRILEKYANMAGYVCTVCGKPAVLETNGYILSFCAECYDKHFSRISAEPVMFVPKYQIIRYENGKKTYHTYSFQREWNRYLKKLNTK